MDVPADRLKSLFAAYNTENLRHRLGQYPGRIYHARQAVNMARKALKDAELERDGLEAEMILLITAEPDTKGKAKYTNVQMRDAELLRRKVNTPQYQDAAYKVNDAETDWMQAQDALQMLLDEYQSARIVARLIAAELSVLSELVDIGDAAEVSAKTALRTEIDKFQSSGFKGSKEREAF